MIPDAVFVDCFGRSYLQDISVDVAGRPWRFIFDDTRKTGVTFTVAMFLDSGILHDRSMYRHPPSRRIFVLLESPNEPQFARVEKIEDMAQMIFTHNEDLLARGPKYQRFDYGVSWINGGIPLVAQQKQQLVSFIGSNQHSSEFGYELRKAAASHFVENPAVDCFGRGIQEIESKLTAIAPYCCSIAMENTQRNYYYTEKLIDCFVGMTVPIYWGCDRIGEVFDERGIIRFQSLEELDGIISNLSFEKYAQMRPYVEANAARVVERRLSSYPQLYTRLVEAISPRFENAAPLSPLGRSKVMAMIRYSIGKCSNYLR